MAKSYTRNSRGKKNSQVNWAGIWSKNIKSKDKLFNSEKLEENKKLLNVQSMLNGEVLRQYPQKQISLSSIVWNPTYNREMNMGHLYKIMSHFDLRALGEILVCDVSKEHGGKTRLYLVWIYRYKLLYFPICLLKNEQNCMRCIMIIENH